MTDLDEQARVLATIRDEIAHEQELADAEHDPVARERRRERVGIRTEVAEEEAAAIAAEISENNLASLSLRVPESLARALKERAAAEHIPTSALVRRLLTQAVQGSPQVLTVDQVEQIARRVYEELGSA